MEKEIVVYYVVVGDSLNDMLELVAKNIDIGWQPFGGIVFLPGKGYAQAMVKYKKQ